MPKKETNHRNDDVNQVFERQQRALNRRRFVNVFGAIFLLIVILVILRFTPYRNVHLELIDAAKAFLKNLTSETAPAERDPKYW